MGNTLLTLLIFEYLLIGFVYLLQGDFGKTLYFVGAAILSLGVIMMK